MNFDTTGWFKYPFTSEMYTVTFRVGSPIRLLKPEYLIETVYERDVSAANIFVRVPLDDVNPSTLPIPTNSTSGTIRVLVSSFHSTHLDGASNVYLLKCRPHIQGDEPSSRLPMEHCINIKYIKQCLESGTVIPHREVLRSAILQIASSTRNMVLTDRKRLLGAFENSLNSIAFAAEFPPLPLVATKERLLSQFVQRHISSPFPVKNYQVVDIARMLHIESRVDEGTWGIALEDLASRIGERIRLGPNLYVDKTGLSFSKQAVNRDRELVVSSKNNNIPVKGGCLFHENELGKTFMALACALVRGPKSRDRKYGTLIVCPGSVVQHWVKELNVLQRTAKVATISRVADCNYYNNKLLQGFDFVIVSASILESVQYTRPIQTYWRYNKMWKEINTCAANDFSYIQQPERLPLCLQMLPFTRLIVDESHVFVRPNIKESLTSFLDSAARLAQYVWHLSSLPLEQGALQIVRYLENCMGGVDRHRIAHDAEPIMSTQFVRELFVIRRTQAMCRDELVLCPIIQHPMTLDFLPEEQSLLQTINAFPLECEGRTEIAFRPYFNHGNNKVSLLRYKTFAPFERRVMTNFLDVLRPKEKAAATAIARHLSEHLRLESEGITVPEGACMQPSRTPYPLQLFRLQQLATERKRAANELKKIENKREFITQSLKDTEKSLYEQRIECGVCLEQIAPFLSTLHCGHHFCTTCICSWLGQQQICPICRSETTSKEISNIPVFRTLVMADEAVEIQQRRFAVNQQLYGTRCANILKLFESLPANEKLIIYSRYRKPINHLIALFKAELPGPATYCVYHGTIIQREKSVTHFMERPACRIIFVVGEGSHSASLNLPNANHILVVDVPTREQGRDHKIPFEHEALACINKMGRREPIHLYYQTV